MQISFAKGHGTLNDFVIIADLDGHNDLSPADVRFLCDRRGGIGGDGVIRVVRGRHIPEWDGDPAVWFMDYRNADGSLSEMCGNGVRVFLAYLKHAGLIPADTECIEIGTRAGLRVGTYVPDGTFRVWMGRPLVDQDGVAVSIAHQSWQARPVDVGNPHVVSVVANEAELAALDLTEMPSWTPAERFPQLVNLEFVTPVAPAAVRMRVYERGCGETKSCGTGTVAVGASLAAAEGKTQASYTIHVPGGTLIVDIDGEDAYLTGPAVIVYEGVVTMPNTEDACD